MAQTPLAFPILLVCLTVSACASAASAPPGELSGSVAFHGTYRAQVSLSEIGTAATVSLIDPANGRTIATTLTQPDRTYTLSIPGFRPQPRPYLLEALKGLSENRAGNDAARLRTIVQHDGAAWHALTTGAADLTDATTALCAIVALRDLPPESMIGRLGSGGGFDAAGSGVDPSEFAQVLGLVGSALAADLDPVAALALKNGTYALADAGPPPFLSGLSPHPVSEGGTLTIEGGGFRHPLGANSISLGGLTLDVATGDARTLVVNVPVGARSGTLTLKTPSGAASADLTVLPRLSGGLLPGPTPGPTPEPGGLSGTLFGR